MGQISMSKKGLLIAILNACILSLVCFSAFGMSGCSPAQKVMKDYVGQTADEVVSAITSEDLASNIQILTENNAPVQVENAGDYKVVQTIPANDSPIEDDKIVLRVEYTNDAKPVLEMAKKAWGDDCKFECFDDGVVSIVRIFVPDSNAAGLSPKKGDINVYTREANEKEFLREANMAGRNCVFATYTKDGYLYSISYVPYERATDEQKAYGAACATQLAEEADAFAKAHSEAFGDGFAARLGQVDGMTGAEWRSRGDGVTFYVYSQVINPSWDAASAADTDDVRSHYQDLATMATYMLRDSVTISFYDANESVFDSFSGSVKPWLPDDVMDLAKKCENSPSGHFEYES